MPYDEETSWGGSKSKKEIDVLSQRHTKRSLISKLKIMKSSLDIVEESIVGIIYSSSFATDIGASLMSKSKAVGSKRNDHMLEQ